ncbi:MAG TPA: DUF2232 domain-containing protein [Geobacteraceae bacterium]|nr:DUF2232 domain-containing protein [Geobacteraceae bacterium]
MEKSGYGMTGAILKGSLLTFGLFLVYSTIPFLGGFAGIFVPFPCVYYSLKYRRVTGLAIVLLVVSALALLEPSGMLQYLVLGVTCSLVLPELLARGTGGARSIGITVGLNALLVAALMILAVTLFAVDLDGQVRGTIHDAIRQVGETYRQAGFSGKELKGLEDSLKFVEQSLVRIYPSLVLLFLGIIAGSNLLILRRFSDSLGRHMEFGAFSRYRNPDGLVWMLIIAGFALLTAYIPLKDTALNVVVIVYALYFIQGLALFCWFTEKMKMSRLTRAIFYALLALQPVLTSVVAIFGLVDLWVDFRTPKIT